ncbi:hypothetical protein [Streptomyces sp. YIM 98790]|uniref:hypothetical protein n=1 Tax=Streptomyces sp. YIM 98790 TaxID=2689077 RepID=UPI00140A396D|nr:hypothetical protein [Streptomyces sp. YIM 98790]
MKPPADDELLSPVPRPDPVPFRELIDDLAERIEATFGVSAGRLHHHADRLGHGAALVAEQYAELLAFAEDVAVTRARLAARPRAPEDEETLRRQLAWQVARRNYRLNVAHIHLSTHPCAPPRTSPCPLPPPPGQCPPGRAR